MGLMRVRKSNGKFFFSFKCFKFDNLIILGDFNFTLNKRETWGSNVRVDILVGFFHNLLNQVGVVDIEPIKLKPTWSNNKSGEDCVSKRLERFLIHGDFI
jgi:hypothetical protein